MARKRLTKKSLAEALKASALRLKEAAEQLDKDEGQRLPADALVMEATAALISGADEYVSDPGTVRRFKQLQAPPLPTLNNSPSRYRVTLDPDSFKPLEQADIYPASYPRPDPGMGEFTCLLELDGDTLYVDQRLHEHEPGGALGRSLIAALVLVPFVERRRAEVSRVVFHTSGLDDPIELPYEQIAEFARQSKGDAAS